MNYHVVAAIIEYEGKVLCMQKGKTKYTYTSYKFEFPGGKVEKEETEQQALTRELREEMNYIIEVGNPFMTIHHAYPDFEITMTSYFCKVVNSQFCMNEHIAYKWLPKDALLTLDWAEADIPIAKKLSEGVQEGVHNPFNKNLKKNMRRKG